MAEEAQVLRRGTPQVHPQGPRPPLGSVNLAVGNPSYSQPIMDRMVKNVFIPDALNSEMCCMSGCAAHD